MLNNVAINSFPLILNCKYVYIRWHSFIFVCIYHCLFSETIAGFQVTPSMWGDLKTCGGGETIHETAIRTTVSHRLFHSATVSRCDLFWMCHWKKTVLGWRLGCDWWVQCIYYLVPYTDLIKQPMVLRRLTSLLLRWVCEGYSILSQPPGHMDSGNMPGKTTAVKHLMASSIGYPSGTHLNHRSMTSKSVMPTVSSCIC